MIEEEPKDTTFPSLIARTRYEEVKGRVFVQRKIFLVI